MRTILRVEHSDGTGMFRRSFKVDLYDMGLDYLEYRHSNFNTPQEDGLDLGKQGKEWFCAYKTAEQFQKWVTKNEVQVLAKNTFKVLMLDVTEYQEGRDQIIFTKESIISSKDVTQLFI